MHTLNFIVHKSFVTGPLHPEPSPLALPITTLEGLFEKSQPFLVLTLFHTCETSCKRGLRTPLLGVFSVLGPPTKTSLAFEGSVRDRRMSLMRS